MIKNLVCDRLIWKSIYENLTRVKRRYTEYDATAYIALAGFYA